MLVQSRYIIYMATNTTTKTEITDITRYGKRELYLWVTNDESLANLYLNDDLDSDTIERLFVCTSEQLNYLYAAQVTDLADSLDLPEDLYINLCNTLTHRDIADMVSRGQVTEHYTKADALAWIYIDSNGGRVDSDTINEIVDYIDIERLTNHLVCDGGYEVYESVDDTSYWAIDHLS